MNIIAILSVLPSILFLAIMLYAVVDAQNVERATREAWSHERDA